MQHNQAIAKERGWIQGAFAGLVGTVPMSVFMLATQRLLPKGQQYALPPELITQELAQRAKLRYKMNKMQILGATTLSHFGYGAAMGLLYRLVEQRRRGLPGAAVEGSLFGLLVWLVSYLALLPLSGMNESGQREPGRRNLMMIAAHLVWGSTMGIAADALSIK